MPPSLLYIRQCKEAAHHPQEGDRQTTCGIQSHVQHEEHIHTQSTCTRPHPASAQTSPRSSTSDHSSDSFVHILFTACALLTPKRCAAPAQPPRSHRIQLFQIPRSCCHQLPRLSPTPLHPRSKAQPVQERAPTLQRVHQSVMHMLHT